MHARIIFALGSLCAACGINEDIHNKALADLAACQQQAEFCNVDLGKAKDELANKLGVATEENQRTSSELASAKTNLEANAQELELLRKQRAAAESRLAAYRSLTNRMQKLVDTGKLKVAFRKGQMVLELPASILFRSGKAKLSARGKVALTAVAEPLLEFKDRRFMIAGHTDNQRIRTKKFPSNWYLSAARAASVVEFFVKQGFVPENIGAAGFGEFDPIGDNEEKEGRQLNRRIEIILVPDLSELPSLKAEPES